MFLFLKEFIYLFLERGEGTERNISVVASCAPPTVGLSCNPGMCPEWELNQQPLGSQVGTQSTEPHQPGLICVSKVYLPNGSLESKETIQTEIIFRSG